MPAPPTPVALHHVVVGPATGKPVVLLHGFPFDGRMWEATAARLVDAGFRVVVPDLRGFGKSPVAEDGSMQAMAADVVRMCEDLKLREVDIVAFSMGGYVALQIGHRNRELFGQTGAIVLVDTRPGADAPSAAAGREELAKKVKAVGMQATVDAMMPNLVSDTTRRTKPQVVKLLEKLMLAQRPEGAIPAIRGMASRPDLRGKLAGMNLPCLVVCGEDDKITPIDDSVRMAQAFRGSSFEAIRGAGHAAPLENPEAFHKVLLEFLQR